MSGPERGRTPASRVLLVACFGAFIAFLDATIVNVAFPSIRASFGGSSISSLSWVLNAYNIVFAAFLIVCGRLTDLLGRRRAFIAGVVVFTIASAWCGVATSVDLLVLARVAQALGAALLVPASLALVVEAFPAQRRAHAIGLWGATAAIAAGLGPPLGGALVQLGGWRWAFLVNLPFGVAAVVAARHDLVESRAPGRRNVPDLRGAGLLASGLALLNLGVVKSSDWGWGSGRALGCFAGAVGLGALFVLSSRHHRFPLVDPELVRIRAFGVASTATVVAGLGFYAYLLTNVLWLQYVWGYGVLRAGLALVPGAVVAAVVAGVLGPLAERTGYRPLVVPGALVWAGAYLWYHQQVGVEPAFWSQWLPGQVLSGIGVGATLPLLASAALAAVPGGRYATASAVVSSARQLGGVLGIALLVAVVGNPTGAGVVDAFRDGWVLSIASFVVVGVLALPLGRIVGGGAQDELGAPGEAVVHVPDPVSEDAVVEGGSGSPAGLDRLPMLAALPPTALAGLATASRVVEVPAGTWLLRAGDPPGSAYVVRSGRLEVLIAGRVVREVGPGAVLGELALLSDAPRSADVRARRDATALEIPRPAFDQLLRDAAAGRAVLHQVALRLRTLGTEPDRSAAATPPRVIAVLGLHRGAAVGPVADALEGHLRRHLSVVRPGVVDADGLARAERSAQRVLLVADADDRAWWTVCHRQADVVVLVGPAGAAPPDEPMPSSSAVCELVLHGTGVPPDRRAAWVAATDAWGLTLADGDLTVALRGLGSRLAGRSLGLVLAGGGARAFVHVGVLRELEDAGLHVDRVAGSSLGALIGAAHASGFDGATLEEACYTEFVRHRPFSDWTLPRHALARGRRTRAALTRQLGADTVLEGLPRQLHVVSTDLVSRTRQVHRRGNLVEAVIASSRLPVLFSPLPQADGRLLVDGGVLDNLPVDLLTERREGPVVAVNVAMGGGGRPRQGAPRVPALGETLLRTMMINSAGAVATAVARGAAVVTPAAQGVGLLEFHQFDRMVASGRAAARALLEQADSWLTAAGQTGRPSPPAPRSAPGPATAPAQGNAGASHES